MWKHALVLVTTAACYGSAQPPPPRPTVPASVPGGRAALGSEYVEKSVDDQLGAVGGFRTYSLDYAGKPVTYSEYRALVDPNWSKTLDRYDELYRKCQRANIPKYIGIAAIVGGFAFALWGDKVLGEREEGDVVQPAIAGGLVGAGVLTYAAGWAVFGGRACNEAGRMWDGEAPWLEMHDDQTPVQHNDFANELRTLTDQFNARVQDAPADPPIEPAPAE